jgi:hypothetical protein
MVATSVSSPTRRSGRRKRKKRSSSGTPFQDNQETNRRYETITETSSSRLPMDCDASPYGSDEDDTGTLPPAIDTGQARLPTLTVATESLRTDSQHIYDTDNDCGEWEEEEPEACKMGGIAAPLADNSQSTIQIVQEFIRHTTSDNEVDDNALDGSKKAAPLEEDPISANEDELDKRSVPPRNY